MERVALNQPEEHDMEVYAIPVIDDDIPTVHDMAWEGHSNGPQHGNNINNGNQDEQGCSIDELLSPLTVSIFGGIRWVAPLTMLLIFVENDGFATEYLPIKMNLGYIEAITLWVGLQAI